MCIECGRIYCADRCPNYGRVSAERGKRRKRCSLCGQGIYEIENFFLVRNLVICEACMKKRENNG